MRRKYRNDEHPDSSLIKGEAYKIYVNDKIDEMPNGRIDFIYNEFCYESFFYKNNSDGWLYVFLNGALTGEQPELKRWSYYSSVNGFYLNIADPMYRKYQDLKLGWYYGDGNIDFRREITHIVKHVQEYLNIKNERVVFYGSSGGGSAAIECAALIKGAKSLTINPQIVLKEYSYASEFSKITGIDIGKEDFFHRNDLRYYLNRKCSKHILIINSCSEEDMLQVDNISSLFNVKVNYGLNEIDNVYIWLYEVEGRPYFSNHVTQENVYFFKCFEFFLSEYIEQGTHIVAGEYVQMINNLWKDYWETQKSLCRKINFNYYDMCKKTNKDVVVWGAGNKFDRIANGVLDIYGANPYRIKRIIDKTFEVPDQNKDNKFLKVTPDEITEWDKMFVIITTENHSKEIARKLESYGLKYRKDYVYYDDLFIREERLK